MAYVYEDSSRTLRNVSQTAPCVPLYGTLFGSGFGINLLERS